MEVNDIKVSFAITTHDETTQLRSLLDQIVSIKTPLDEIVVVDDFSTNTDTIAILNEYTEKHNIRWFQNKLNGDFASQKNFLTSKCKGEYVFNIDADELLDEKLARSFREILAINPEVEMFRLPRVNKVAGLTLGHVNQWRWAISGLASEVEEKSLVYDSDEYRLLKSFNLVITDNQGMIKFYTPIINWPDFQGRIYKVTENIRWQNKVHEVLVGYKKFAKFPSTKPFALLHYKEIQTQEKQNAMYSTI